ncbi:MAG: PIN domain-containing protein, partial [bacterium]|nr:PIN domain-containing protein [bacterium]
MKQNLFIDTSVICSLYNSKDSLHIKAQGIKPLLDIYNPVVSNFILLETYTVLSQRISKHFSVDFGKNVYKDRIFTVIWIDRKLEEEIWDIFVSIKDKNFSYVDASTLAVLKKERIGNLLSFDSSFAKLEEKFNFKLIGA